MSKTVSEVPTRRSNSMFPLILCKYPLAISCYLDILFRIWRSDLADLHSLYPPGPWSLYIYTRVPRVLKRSLPPALAAGERGTTPGRRSSWECFKGLEGGGSRWISEGSESTRSRGRNDGGGYTVGLIRSRKIPGTSGGVGWIPAQKISDLRWPRTTGVT
jgi:hypothetical protein